MKQVESLTLRMFTNDQGEVMIDLSGGGCMVGMTTDYGWYPTIAAAMANAGARLAELRARRAEAARRAALEEDF